MFTVIAQVKSQGPDGVKYRSKDPWCILIKGLAEQHIPEDWLDSHLALVPKPSIDSTGIKGYRIVMMQKL